MKLFILQYIDPGAGSLLTQLLLSIGIGAGFYLMTARRRIGNWFKRRQTEHNSFGDEPKIEPKEE